MMLSGTPRMMYPAGDDKLACSVCLTLGPATAVVFHKCFVNMSDIFYRLSIIDDFGKM